MVTLDERVSSISGIGKMGELVCRCAGMGGIVGAAARTVEGVRFGSHAIRAGGLLLNGLGAI